jgi:hypothetical protein
VHEVSFILFFLVPVMLLTLLYLRIALVISRSARQDNLRLVKTTILVLKV